MSIKNKNPAPIKNEQPLIQKVQIELEIIIKDQPERLLEKNPASYIRRMIEMPIWKITNIFNEDEKKKINDLVEYYDLLQCYNDNYREFIWKTDEYKQWLIDNPHDNENEEDWYEQEFCTWFEDIYFQYFIIDEILFDILGENELDRALMKVDVNPKHYCGEVSDELLNIRRLNWKKTCYEISHEDYEREIEILEAENNMAIKRKDTERKNRKFITAMKFINELVK